MVYYTNIFIITTIIYFHIMVNLYSPLHYKNLYTYTIPIYHYYISFIIATIYTFHILHYCLFLTTSILIPIFILWSIHYYTGNSKTTLLTIYYTKVILFTKGFYNCFPFSREYKILPKFSSRHP